MITIMLIWILNQFKFRYNAAKYNTTQHTQYQDGDKYGEEKDIELTKHTP